MTSPVRIERAQLSKGRRDCQGGLCRARWDEAPDEPQCARAMYGAACKDARPTNARFNARSGAAHFLSKIFWPPRLASPNIAPLRMFRGGSAAARDESENCHHTQKGRP